MSFNNNNKNNEGKQGENSCAILRSRRKEVNLGTKWARETSRRELCSEWCTEISIQFIAWFIPMEKPQFLFLSLYLVRLLALLKCTCSMSIIIKIIIIINWNVINLCRLKNAIIICDLHFGFFCLLSVLLLTSLTRVCLFSFKNSLSFVHLKINKFLFIFIAEFSINFHVLERREIKPNIFLMFFCKEWSTLRIFEK